MVAAKSSKKELGTCVATLGRLSVLRFDTSSLIKAGKEPSVGVPNNQKNNPQSVCKI